MKQLTKFLRKLVGFPVLGLAIMQGCDSFVDTEPPSSEINSLNVYNQDGTAIAAVTELYGKLLNQADLSYMVGLSADDFSLFSGATLASSIQAYRNDLISMEPPSFWRRYYELILSANTSLEGVLASTGLYSVVKQQLLGECYFMRAFAYFHLVNLYGDAPLALTSDPNINNELARSPKDKVYEQILKDLLQAHELLNPDYVDREMLPYAANAERVRPNRAVATALLAKTYLYLGKYAEAEQAASEVIQQNDLYALLPLNDVFLKNSKEAIWQLQPTTANRNTNDGFRFILPVNGPNASANPVYLSPLLLEAFEADDDRANLGNWVNQMTTQDGVTYHYPFKYKANGATVTEYVMVLRLAEQYLIRAEARAYQNKLTGANSAASDLNIIRERAGLPSTTYTTQAELLDAILQERRVELFTEWGHRWLDLKRTGKVDEVMEVATGEKGGTWESYQQWYPIPFNDIQRGPNLKQNQGYE